MKTFLEWSFADAHAAKGSLNTRNDRAGRKAKKLKQQMKTAKFFHGKAKEGARAGRAMFPIVGDVFFGDQIDKVAGVHRAQADIDKIKKRQDAVKRLRHRIGDNTKKVDQVTKKGKVDINKNSVKFKGKEVHPGRK